MATCDYFTLFHAVFWAKVTAGTWQEDPWVCGQTDRQT